MIGWSREQIIHRNNQLAKYRQSREDIITMNNAAWRAELKSLVNKLLDGYHTKSEKGAILYRLRQLESLLSISLGDYNSSDFAKDYRENNA